MQIYVRYHRDSFVACSIHQRELHRSLSKSALRGDSVVNDGRIGERILDERMKASSPSLAPSRPSNATWEGHHAQRLALSELLTRCWVLIDGLETLSDDSAHAKTRVDILLEDSSPPKGGKVLGEQPTTAQREGNNVSPERKLNFCHNYSLLDERLGKRGVELT